MKINQYLIDFYNNYDEDNRLTVKHGTVEFITTIHYIDKYLKPGDCVLEIGAGTGRYSHTLARKGYSVDAVELVEHNIEMFRKIHKPVKKYPLCRELLWIYQLFQIANTILRCC